MFRRALRKMLEKEAYPYFDQWEKNAQTRDALVAQNETGKAADEVEKKFWLCQMMLKSQML